MERRSRYGRVVFRHILLQTFYNKNPFERRARKCPAGYGAATIGVFFLRSLLLIRLEAFTWQSKGRSFGLMMDERVLLDGIPLLRILALDHTGWICRLGAFVGVIESERTWAACLWRR